ncbi:hypothetical protein C8R43DRAFT_1125159 [Mycena crocata]|nr:hypothetical protein C8R43DRAFT_1125159 [Mycena crocata]
MCKFEINVDFYIKCEASIPSLSSHYPPRLTRSPQHPWNREYTGMKVPCDSPTCKTSPQHVHTVAQKCNCPSVVEDIPKTRNVEKSLCPSCLNPNLWRTHGPYTYPNPPTAGRL